MAKNWKMGFCVPGSENRFPPLLLTAQGFGSNAVLTACDVRPGKKNEAVPCGTTVPLPFLHSKGQSVTGKARVLVNFHYVQKV